MDWVVEQEKTIQPTTYADLLGYIGKNNVKSGCLKIGYAPIQVFKSTENRAHRLNFRDAAFSIKSTTR